jgi:ABC-type uncharacterized transport system substrate-binding protein
MRLIGLAVVLTFSLILVSLAEGQGQTSVYRVGVLLGAPMSAVEASVRAFRDGLRELGYVEGQNLALEVRWRSTEEGRLDALAADLIAGRTHVLVTWTTAATVAAKRATSTVPIVMIGTGDPVGSGLVASLSRPGGNITGLTTVSLDLIGKQLQLLTQLRPGATRFAVLGNPANALPSVEAYAHELQTAAQSLGVQLQFVAARDRRELEAVFVAMSRDRVSGILVGADQFFLTERGRIVDLAKKAQLATMFARREYVEAGGLASYGAKLAEQFRQAATYVDKILKGAKPADLPVEQPTKFELVVNLKTAKALGLTIPQSVLLRADQLIE